MHHEARLVLGVDIVRGPEAGRHEARERLAAVRRRQFADGPEHAALDLVANLHHLGLLARSLEVGEDFFRVVVDVLFEPLGAMAFPRGRRDLMAGVGPPVAVVEVDEHFQAERVRALRHLQRELRVHVAAALRRMVPDAEAHPVHAMVLHDLELVHRRAVLVIILRAGRFHLGQHRDVRAFDEVCGQPRNRIDLHRSIRARRKAGKRARSERREQHAFPRMRFHK